MIEDRRSEIEDRSTIFGTRSSAVWRLLDANANRAREGLRVIEDTARFILVKPKAAKAIRRLRHDLDGLVRRHYRTLLAARDSAHDPGRANKAKAYKGGVSALLAANFKRATEALRVLEEYGRVLSPAATKRAQALRFEVYQWETKLLLNGLKKHGSTS